MSLVRAVIGDREVNVSPEYAEAHGLEVLADEPTHRPDGRTRPETRRGGRPLKPQTTVSTEAAKKAGQPLAADPTPSKEK